MKSKTDLKIALAVLACLLLLASVALSGCGGPAAGKTSTAANTLKAGKVSVETAASTPAAGPVFTFAVCGDNRIDGIESGVLGRITVSARSKGAAFIVDTGDVTGDGSPAQLHQFEDFTGRSGIRFFCAPGNHDVGKGGINQNFRDIVGPYYFSFDYGGSHFIILDNADDSTGINPVQMRWYLADLKANAGRNNIFIFSHIPVSDPSLILPHTTGEGGEAGLQSGKELGASAAAQGNVRDFFFGHIHAYWAYRLDGIPAYITGGAGAPLYLPSFLGGYYHYLLVTVRGRQVSVEVVKV